MPPGKWRYPVSGTDEAKKCDDPQCRSEGEPVQAVWTVAAFIFRSRPLAGGKLWRWNYRHAGKRKTMALGNYPDVPLLLARERHLAGRGLLVTGIDPMEKRKEAKLEAKISQESAFSNVASKWLEHWKHGKSLRYVDSTSRRLETNILPFLGDKLVTEITAPHLVNMVKVIQDRGAWAIAKRALETTGQIFRFAVAHCYAERNQQLISVLLMSCKRR